MIFNTDTGYGVVKESPYELGIEGALMHVYENECNYNALMRAVGISELKYYQETGRELFVNEAGAFSGFIDKVKAFFKKIIEKIKQIFHKFAAKIMSLGNDDKGFVKKYEKEILRKNIKDMTFKGYTFKGVKNGWEPKYTSSKEEFNGELQGITNLVDTGDFSKSNDYDLDKEADAMRADMLADLMDSSTNALDTSEFSSELQEALYGGEKEELEGNRDFTARELLSVIADSNKTVKQVERNQKEAVKGIEDFIKDLEKVEKTFLTGGDRAKVDNADNKQKMITNKINFMKEKSNAYTVAFGAVTRALVDYKRQCKAICVKIIGYKHESADLYYESSNDLFADVVIR